jgi:hypothetical protein
VATRPAGQVAEASLEKIAAQRPDLIVAQADLVSDTFDELSRIASPGKGARCRRPAHFALGEQPRTLPGREEQQAQLVALER